MSTREKGLHERVKFAHFSVGNFGERVGTTGLTHPISGYATVAAVRDGERYEYAVSLCAPEDNFCRSKGRMKALQKLMGDQSYLTSGVMTVPEDWKNSRAAEQAVSNVLVALQLHAKPSIDEPRWWELVDPTTDISLKAKKFKERV